MRLLLVLLVGCHAARPVAPANVTVTVLEVAAVTIDPDSSDLRDKQRYWRKWSRAYMSKVPGPICLCEQIPSFVIDTPTGPQPTYMTSCSTYR